MLTQLTQFAIAILCDISAAEAPYQTSRIDIKPETFRHLVELLEKGKLIRRKKDSVTDSSNSETQLHVYELTRPNSKISLLDILEATGEHLNCNHPAKEEMYQQYRTAAHRLGIINQITRLYLSEIKLIDL